MEEMNEQNNQQSPIAKKSNKSALASFILSLVGLLVAGIPCGIAALITGVTGIKTFNAETEKNKWMAIFGIVLGAVDIIAVLTILPAIYESLGL